MGEIKKRHSFLIVFFTGVIVGSLFGVLALNALISYRLDMYHKRIKYLETVIDEKNIKLEKLEESINKKRYILKDIDIIFIDKNDDIDRLTLEKSIKEKYSKLIGKEVRTIDPDMLVEIVDKRIMVIDNRKYKLRLNKLMLTETLVLWIEVSIE